MATVATPEYGFWDTVGKVVNSGQSRCLVLTGNVADLFYSPAEDAYLTLLQFLLARWDSTPQLRQNLVKVVYQLNGAIRFTDPDHQRAVRAAWVRLMDGWTPQKEREEKILAVARPSAPDPGARRQELEQQFDTALLDAAGNSMLGLQLLRQMCQASRAKVAGEFLLPDKQLVVIVDAADMLAPPGEIAHLSEADRRRIEILRDWFSDPEFAGGTDTVILVAEARGQLNDELTRLPQLLDVAIPLPDAAQRLGVIQWFGRKQQASQPPRPQIACWCGPEELAALAASLSAHALLQMLKGCAYSGKPLQQEDVAGKVEEYVRGQMGEDVVDFERPTGGLDDVIGNGSLKRFLADEFLPRLEGISLIVFVDEADTAFGGVGADVHETERRLTGGFQNMMSDDRISQGGAIVCGSNGAGKTFLYKKLAAACHVPILTIKNLRSMWYGQTDVLKNRLERSLRAFGGKVFWLLLTARVNLLSSDIRRSGRCGDFIMPVLDPQGDDLETFVKWTLKPADCPPAADTMKDVLALTAGRSAADFDLLRRDMKYRRQRKGSALTEAEVLEVIAARIPGDIARQRRIQTLYALLNCTHTRLLPLPPNTPADEMEKARDDWRRELGTLETAERLGV